MTGDSAAHERETYPLPYTPFQPLPRDGLGGGVDTLLDEDLGNGLAALAISCPLLDLFPEVVKVRTLPLAPPLGVQPRLAGSRIDLLALESGPAEVGSGHVAAVEGRVSGVVAGII